MNLKHILLSIFLLLNSINIYASDTLTKKYKEKKIYPMGKKIYEKMCSSKIDTNSYQSIEMLTQSIKDDKLCKSLGKKHLEALSLYLWDVTRVGQVNEEVIVVTKKEKCPICGMYIYKYPKWATQIFYEDKHFSFDGVKDLMKYYFKNIDGIQKILVNDYYSQKAIDARKAYYVIGSDIYGPMGNELIAFKKESDAKTFYLDHRGIKIIYFDDITAEDIYKLDE